MNSNLTARRPRPVDAIGAPANGHGPVRMPKLGWFDGENNDAHRPFEW